MDSRRDTMSISGFESKLLQRLEGKGYNRELVPYNDWVSTGRYKAFNGIVMGNSGATYRPTKKKWIDEIHYPYPYAERGREYLNYIWEEQEPSRKRVGWNRDTMKYLDIQPPGIFTGPVSGELAYVDIVACYASLYSPVSLDMRFSHSPMYMLLGRVGFLEQPYLFNQKKVRNAIGGGLIRNTSIRIYSQKAKGLRDTRNWNKFLSPELWGYMMYSLHAAAYEIHQLFGCYYWNFDGCIVDRSRAQLVREYLAEKWLLETTVQGESDTGRIYGWGSHEIGHKRSKRILRGNQRQIYNILPYDDLLATRLKEFRRWAITKTYGAL